MQNVIRGKAYVLGDNIDTDQIIPAKYLAYNPSDAAERKYFGMYAMDGVPVAQRGLGGVLSVLRGAAYPFPLRAAVFPAVLAPGVLAPAAFVPAAFAPAVAAF